MSIVHAYAQILDKIADAASRAGRQPRDVRVVAAVKGQGGNKIREALNAGLRCIGHNYLQEALKETPTDLPADAELHMIGHLQRNKAGKAASLFHVIQTVDNIELAEALNAKAASLGRNLRALIQVSLAGEIQKSGIEPEGVDELAVAIQGLPHLELRGLMTMPPFFDDPDAARPYFARLRKLRDRLLASGVLGPGMTELSMGMTGDFEVAVEEGATLVRIGTALFGAR
jgi:PLP dependent protein